MSDQISYCRVFLWQPNIVESKSSNQLRVKHTGTFMMSVWLKNGRSLTRRSQTVWSRSGVDV